MNQKKKARIFLVVLILAAAAIIGLAIWEVVTNGFSSRLMIRCAVPLAGLILAAARVYSAAGGGNKRLYALYEKEYKEHISGAFARNEQKKEKKLLMEAISCFNSDRYTKGIDILQKLISKCSKPNDYAAVYTFLGLMYERTANREAALEAYKTVLKYDGKRSVIWSNLGSVYKSKGLNKDAVTCYRNAIDIDPKNSSAYHNMGFAYFQMGDYGQAVELASKAYEIKQLRQSLDLICLAYAAWGKDEESKKYYDLAISAGADAEILQNALQKALAGRVAKESFVPVPTEIENACNGFYRETALPYMCIGILNDETHSRIGGASLGDVPHDSNGNEMRLLCAIDCTEVRGLANFPESGWLLFYIADNRTYGADFNFPAEQKDFRVIYTQTQDLKIGSEPEHSDFFPVKGCYNIAFVADTCAMNFCDYRFEDTMNKHLKRSGAPEWQELDEDIQEEITERFVNVGHHLYGTPMFAQYDPRENDEYKKFDTLLLQISTHRNQEGEKIVIGDEGAIQFFIPAENLKNKDFSEILYWWDCH